MLKKYVAFLFLKWYSIIRKENKAEHEARFFNGLFCIALIVLFVLIVFLGIKAVTNGQENNELYKQYLYQER